MCLSQRQVEASASASGMSVPASPPGPVVLDLAPTPVPSQPPSPRAAASASAAALVDTKHSELAEYTPAAPDTTPLALSGHHQPITDALLQALGVKSLTAARLASEGFVYAHELQLLASITLDELVACLKCSAFDASQLRRFLNATRRGQPSRSGARHKSGSSDRHRLLSDMVHVGGGKYRPRARAGIRDPESDGDSGDDSDGADGADAAADDRATAAYSDDIVRMITAYDTPEGRERAASEWLSEAVSAVGESGDGDDPRWEADLRGGAAGVRVGGLSTNAYLTGDDAIEMVVSNQPCTATATATATTATTNTAAAAAAVRAVSRSGITIEPSADSTATATASALPLAQRIRIRRRRRDDPLVRAAYSAAIARAASEYEPPPARPMIVLMSLIWALHAVVLIGYSVHVVTSYVAVDSECREYMLISNSENACFSDVRCSWRPANAVDANRNRNVCSAGTHAVGILSITALAMFFFAINQCIKLVVIACRVSDENEPDHTRHWNLGGNLVSTSPFMCCISEGVWIGRAIRSNPSNRFSTTRLLNWNAPILKWIDFATLTLPYLISSIWFLVARGLAFGGAAHIAWAWIVLLVAVGHTFISFSRRRGGWLHKWLSPNAVLLPFKHSSDHNSAPPSGATTPRRPSIPSLPVSAGDISSQSAAPPSA